MFNYLFVKLVPIALVCISHTTEAASCNGTARYKLTFTAEWTRESHADFPSNAHFSRLVGCSHNGSYVMWTPGKNATTGVKNVAELGSTTALNSEMDQQITLKKAHKKYQGSADISGGTGTSVIKDIEVTSKYPLVSFISMIAPSPDWFLGVHDFSLCNTTTGEWVDSKRRDLPLYDAGTDSGPRFNSSNMPTNPAENIFLITNNTEGSLKGDKPLKPFGTFAFAKSNAVPPLPKSSTPTPSSTPTSISASTSTNTSTPTSISRSTPTSIPTSTNTTKPSDAAHPLTSVNIPLVLIFCILNIFFLNIYE